MTNPVVVNFRPMRRSYRSVAIALEFLDEGWNGDFDPLSKRDEPLLRFTVTAKHAAPDEEPRSESYCTAVNAVLADRRRLWAIALGMAREFHALGSRSWRRRAQEWSHL